MVGVILLLCELRAWIQTGLQMENSQVGPITYNTIFSALCYVVAIMIKPWKHPETKTLGIVFNGILRALYNIYFGPDLTKLNEPNQVAIDSSDGMNTNIIIRGMCVCPCTATGPLQQVKVTSTLITNHNNLCSDTQLWTASGC